MPPPFTNYLVTMLLSSVCYAIMGVTAYQAHQFDPEASVLSAGLVRIALSLVLVSTPFLWMRRGRELWGDFSPALWLRGICGGVTLMLYFAAIQSIGPGDVAFLYSTNGIFIAALSPLVLGEKSSPLLWLAILGAFAGMWFLLEPSFHDTLATGRILGLCAGVVGAVGYLAIAKMKAKNGPAVLIFYFSVAGLLVHLIALACLGGRLPNTAPAWGMTLISGVAACAGQLFMTMAYQRGPAAQVAAISYTAPVMNVALAWWCLGMAPHTHALLGGALIVICGVLLPLLKPIRI